MSEAFAKAMHDLGSATRSAAHAMTRFYWGWSYAYLANTPREKRRMIRDKARAMRRPALIHNGRKPRA